MKIAIIAGEASGDILGADIMTQMPDDEFAGIGGASMKALGLQSLFPMTELSVMGIAEVLPRLRGLFRRINQAADFVASGDFDALITIDSPDFSFRVAKRVKKIHPDLPIIHYVAPSVWAWRAGRAAKMARYVDHVLCLLPFEPPYMHAAGMSADFVGHPVSRQLPPNAADMDAWHAANPRTIAMFPGSRGSEMRNHLPTLRAVWDVVVDDHIEGFQLQIPVPDHVYPSVVDAFEGAKNVHIFSPQTMTNSGGIEAFNAAKLQLMHGAKLAVATSGTVSFELAFADTPTIVGYKTSRLNAFLYRRMMKVKYASLANILLDAPVIPEFLFDDFKPEALTGQVRAALADPEFAARQHAGFDRMRAMMVPDMDAAASVRRFLAKMVLKE